MPIPIDSGSSPTCRATAVRPCGLDRSTALLALTAAAAGLRMQVSLRRPGSCPLRPPLRSMLTRVAGGRESPFRLSGQRTRFVGRPLRRIAALAAGLIVVLGACTGPPLLEPNIVGVVAEVDRDAGDVLVVRFEDGGSVRIEGVSRSRLEGGTEPGSGDLLLLGDTREGVWHVALTPDSDPPVSPCWTASWFAREDDGAILFDNGLRLPTSPDFDGSLSPDGRFTNPAHRFCLNERGEVTAYR